MSLQFWKELVITQTSTASVSLVASTAIVAFISKNGLSTPYRRLIFGLSISDICQSLAIVAGPWLTRADVLQAIWGMGNKHTCRLDGFLFLVGMTAAPMYTLCLCIYYVFKLRWKMTDASFAHKVEKKMHAIIIMINACLYFTALGMDTINPAVNGTVCLAAALPTGCRQNPEMFGECDEKISAAAQFFTTISSFVVPILCLFGDILCLAMIFWHVLAREKIFGGSSNRRQQLAPHHDFTSDGNSNSNGTQNGNRRHHLQSPSFIASSDLSSDVTGMNDDNASLLLKRIHHKNNGNKPQSPSTVDLESCQFHNKNEPNGNGNVNALFPISSLPRDTTSSAGDTAAGKLLPPEVTQEVRGTNNNYRQASASEQQTTRAVTVVVAEKSRDLETISRLYKKELLTQACCYVLVFCISAMPFMILNIILITGTTASRTMFRACSWLYPLAGLFNIIVYTRPNVASLRRSCPQCSRLQAFWLVLKEGGEVPDMDDLNDTGFWNLGLGDCFHLCGRNNKHAVNLTGATLPLPIHNEPDRRDLPEQQQQQCEKVEGGEEEEDRTTIDPESMPIKMANIYSQETISDLRVGVASRPVVTSSLPPSNAGMNGLSMSFENDNPAHRATEDWHHCAGGGKSQSMLVGSIPESSANNNGGHADADADSEVPPSQAMPPSYSDLSNDRPNASIPSQEGGGDNGKKENKDDIWEGVSDAMPPSYSDLSNDRPTASIPSQQGGGYNKKKENKDDIWEAAFERARNLRFSE